MPEIHIPRIGWNLRAGQEKFWRALVHDNKNAVACWHRRFGKDEVALNALAVKAMQRPASYAYMLPEISHARRAIWQAVNPHTGKRRILETFQPEMLDGEPNETEMRIKLVNGSQVLFFGSDQYDRLVGASLAGIISSEHALAHPSAYGYFSPMLRENNGFFAAISTPRGRNHFYDLFNYAGSAKGWFAERLSIHDTLALTLDEIEDARAEYIAMYGIDQGNALFQQEYEVSFNAAIMGAFYGGEMAAVRSEKRITSDVEALEGRPVHRAWDIGVRDDTSIWWFQVVGTQIYILDCYSKPGESDIEVFAEMVHSKNKEMGWTNGIDFVPHDARQKVWGMKRGRLETMQEFGLNPRVVPNLSKLDGINAVRRTLPRCVFHTRTEDVGITALEQYRREWDDERKTYKANEVHDWTSHACFAGETMVLTRHGMHRIDSLPSTGEVMTQCGWKPYHSPRMTRKSAPIVEVAFADGLTVRCTPDHMFLTAEGWISAKSLRKGTEIQSFWMKSRNTTMAAYTEHFPANAITSEAGYISTGRLGRMLLDLSQRAATFIIETAIQLITQSSISNAFQRASTYPSHGKTGLTEAIEAALPLVRRLGKRRPNGIDRQKAGFGTAATPRDRRHGRSGGESLARALIAASYSIASYARMGISKSFAGLTARRLIIESVRPLEYRDDVWCLTVPAERSFSLSNGAIVHNCDAFRYLALSWEEARDPLPNKPERPVVGDTLDNMHAPPLPR